MSDAYRRRVIVLFGGQSAEHDVSCSSAVAVLRSLDPSRYDVVPVGVTREGQWVRSESAEKMLANLGAEIPKQLVAAGPSVGPDMLLPTPTSGPARVESLSQKLPVDELPVVLPILHGPFGEDGTMQGLLELAGVPFVGSGVAGSAVSMDKGLAKHILATASIPQARYLVRAAWDLSTRESLVAFAMEIREALGWPAFVKPANLGSSVGVSKARDVDEIVAAVELAAGYDDWVVVEEAITGREIEFAVLGNEHPIVSAPGEIIPGREFYDYEDKYLDDGAKLLIPAPLTDEQLAEGQHLAIAAYKALRCEGLARVDFFLEEGGRGWLVNEANTMPGFTPISMYPKLWAAGGLSYGELLDRLIELAVARYSRRSGKVGRGRAS